MYLTQGLHRTVQRDPQRTFSIDGARTLTYQQAVERIARLAAGLRAFGVGTDDRLAILALNSDGYVQSLLAIAWADAVMVPVNIRWSVPEIAYSFEEADVATLLVDAAFAPMVEALKTAVPRLKNVVYVGENTVPVGMTGFEQLIADSAPIGDAHRRGDALAGIFYTGGTTGFPKGVMLSHRNIATSAMGFASVGELTPGGRTLYAAPIFHLAALASFVAATIMGSTHVSVPQFEPLAVLSAIEKHRVTDALLVPTMIQLLVDHPDVDAFDVSSIAQLFYGASPISDALLVRARAVLSGAKFIQGYGMTELSPVATLLEDADHDDPQLRRSAGRAAPHALVKVVDPDGNEVPRGTVGEIVCSGDHVMLGYWNKPQETAAAVRDGWMHTGDGGYMDERGYVFVVDRIKDMIITGGENVYSAEVENVIAQHPAVAQCAVIGVADAQWGERVHAVVALVPGAELTVEELREHCRAQIAGYKCPRSLEIVTEFPMSAAGKILKRELRERHR
ncbi:MAG TPA: long-chain fatty acid--CoA ligase [Jatrophihabitantaceae bacterium]|jgi:acyl-CoA synthetase (AMP-forming)/AMP-acid ligase II